MAYLVTSGSIAPNVLYMVTGAQSVTYNAVMYTMGQTFRGIAGINTFAYSGMGTQEVNEVLELAGGGVTYVENSADLPLFSIETKLTGMAIEYAINEAEKKVNEVTKIKGFALELVDYPFYSFEITETRL